MKTVSDRLAAARVELDQCAEWVGRIQADIAAAEAGTLPPIVSASEAADILGISVQRVSQLRRAGQFLEPAVTLSCGAIWLRSEMEAFARVRAA